MRILYVTQWFEPEPAFKGSGFAAALAHAGHEVRVATGFPNYPTGRIYKGYKLRFRQREVIAGVTVDRLPLWPSHDRSALGRSLNYLSFFVSVLIYALLGVRRYDAIYVYHPPITPALAIAVAQLFRPVSFVVDIQDLWPDSVASSGMANRIILRVLDRLCQWVYRRAAHIICQSDGMVERLADRGVQRSKLSRIYNWSNYSPAQHACDAVSADINDAFAGRTNIVYGGNIGQAQALEALVEACGRASASVPKVRLHIFGQGIEKARIEALAAKYPDHVRVYGALPRSAMDRVFERADVLAMHLKDDPLFDITIPSKLQHYLSVGKPMLAGVGGEAAQILTECGSAVICEPMDAKGLAEGMVKLAVMESAERAAMGAKGREYYRRHMSFDAALGETLLTISRASQPRMPDRRRTSN